MAQAERALRWLLWVVGGLLAALGLTHIVLSAVTWAFPLMDHKSGIYAVLADDVAHGTLYRPIMGPLGYGGTRYMWLQPVLAGGLAKLGIPLVHAEALISFLAAAGLCAAVYGACRRAGVERWIALVAGAGLIAVKPFQDGMVTYASDTLAAAIAFLGFALAVDPPGASRGDEGRGRRLVGFALLGLAFCAKQTSLAAAGAVGLTLLGTRRWKRAGTLAGLGALFVVLGVAVPILAATSAQQRAYGPMSTALFTHFSLTQRFLDSLRTLARLLPHEPVVLLGAAVAVLRATRRETRDVYLVLWLLSAAAAVVIFMHPGTDTNHLIELAAAGLILVGLELQRAGTAPLGLALRGVCVAIFCFRLWSFGGDVRLFESADFPGAHRDELAPLLAELRAAKGPVLSEHPLIPILAGVHPTLGCPMTLGFLSRYRPTVREDFHARMTAKEFPYIVLINNPELSPDWYDLDPNHMGPGFACDLLTNYHYTHDVAGQFLVYEPSATSTRSPLCDRGDPVPPLAP